MKDGRSIPVLAICNPLMDYITHVDADFLQKTGVRPGSMNLVDREVCESVLSSVGEYVVIPGGSGANTLRGFCWLDKSGDLNPPVYYGAVGNDAMGNEYAKRLMSSGVESRIVFKKAETGISVVTVTPDRERTMFTFLGACRTISERDIDFSLVAASNLLHITGYMWDTENQKSITKQAVFRARASRTIVSFDLADPFVVDRYRDEFLSWIPANVDLLFGNRDEFSLLTGLRGDDEIVAAAARRFARTVVMKSGEKGACAYQGETCVSVRGKKVAVRDTTGAGDAFAGGFLFELLSGKSILQCLETGNALAAAIVEVEGCDYSKINRLPGRSSSS